MKKNSLELKPFRRRLRNGATPAEQHVWQYLRQRRLGGWKFVRQYSIGPYVLDFFCPRANLAIELDGGHHARPDQRLYDAGRSARLALDGVTVLRFWNSEALEQTEAVLDKILLQLERSRQGPEF